MTDNVNLQIDNTSLDVSTEISRSYSQGIDTNNLLQVNPQLSSSHRHEYRQSSLSMTLKVRSNPSSPNRASRVHNLTRMHKKWLNSRALNTYPSSSLSNDNCCAADYPQLCSQTTLASSLHGTTPVTLPAHPQSTHNQHSSNNSVTIQTKGKQGTYFNHLDIPMYLTIQSNQLSSPNYLCPLSAPLSASGSYQQLHQNNTNSKANNYQHRHQNLLLHNLPSTTSTANLSEYTRNYPHNNIDEHSSRNKELYLQNYQSRSDRDLRVSRNSLNILVKQAAVEDETGDKVHLSEQCRLSCDDSKSSQANDTKFNIKESNNCSSVSLNSPVNFKKVLRDRYYNSQRSSNTSTVTTFSSTSSGGGAHIHSLGRGKAFNFSGHEDSVSSYRTNFTDSLFSESEDHNFHFLRQTNVDSIQKNDSLDSSNKKDDKCSSGRTSLSLDLLNLTTPKKFRLQSTNSTISSISNAECDAAVDPFSPAATEICSPFLNLKFRKHLHSSQKSENSTPNISGNTNNRTAKFQSSIEESQKFFPDNCAISNSKLDEIVQQYTSGLQENIRPNDKRNCCMANNYTRSCRNNNKTTNNNKNENPNHTGNLESVNKMHFSKSMDQLASNYASNSNQSQENKDKVTKKILQSKTAKPTLNKIRKSQSNDSTNTQSSIDTETTNSCHSTNRKCKICGRCFSRRDMLARHIRVHTGHKPFECLICTQTFSRSDHLNTHMRIHSGEKPYHCSLCNYSACRRDMITRHLRVHKRKGDIPQIEQPSNFVINTNKLNQVTNTKQPVESFIGSRKTKSHNNLIPISNSSSISSSLSSSLSVYTNPDVCQQQHQHRRQLEERYDSIAAFKLKPHRTPHSDRNLFRSQSFACSKSLDSNVTNPSNICSSLPKQFPHDMFSCNVAGSHDISYTLADDQHCTFKLDHINSMQNNEEENDKDGDCDDEDDNDSNRLKLLHRLHTSNNDGNPREITPQTFGNISISICQPTPRSSFSLPAEHDINSNVQSN